MKEDWLEYFELINKREPSFEEFLAAKKKGYLTSTSELKDIEESEILSVEVAQESPEANPKVSILEKAKKYFMEIFSKIRKVGLPSQMTIFDLLAAIGGIFLLMGIYAIKFVNFHLLNFSLQGSLASINAQVKNIAAASTKLNNLASLLDKTTDSQLPEMTSELSSQLELVGLAVNSLVIFLTVTALFAILSACFKQRVVKIIAFLTSSLSFIVCLALSIGVRYAASSLDLPDLPNSSLMTNSVTFFLIVGSLAMLLGYAIPAFKKKN